MCIRDRSTAEPVGTVDVKWDAICDTFLRTCLCALSAADTGVGNHKAADLFFCASIGEAFSVNGVTEQIEPFAIPLIDEKRIEYVAALSRINLIHPGILQKYFIHPLFFHHADLTGKF